MEALCERPELAQPVPIPAPVLSTLIIMDWSEGGRMDFNPDNPAILTPAQARTYKTQMYFDVEVNGRTYRIIGTSRCFNVQLLIDGRPHMGFCAGPRHHTSMHYFVLAQLLMLTTNECQFLRIANRQLC